MILKILKGGPMVEQVAGAAKTPGKRFVGEGEQEETFEMEEPGIYLGEEWLKGEHGPPEVAMAHEIYHSMRSPRRKISEEDLSRLAYVEDEIEAVLFAAQSTGLLINRQDVEGIKKIAQSENLSGSDWKTLVEDCASRVGYESSLRDWGI